MKRAFMLGAVMAVAALGFVASSAAITTDTDGVCSSLDSGKIDVGDGNTSITVTAPEGFLIDGYCVKAGSENQEDGGPEYVNVDPPQASVTFSHSTGKDISHYSVSYTEDGEDEECPEPGDLNGDAEGCGEIIVPPECPNGDLNGPDVEGCDAIIVPEPPKGCPEGNDNGPTLGAYEPETVGPPKTPKAPQAEAEAALPPPPDRSAPSRIYIPRLNLATPVFSGSPNQGPSWWTRTGRPGGGDTVAIAGHRTTYTKPFYWLETLRPGDRIFIAYRGVTTEYRVTGNRTLSASNMHIADARGREILILSACTPRGSADFRLVVYAQPVSS